jgi:transcriptional regulator with XRE-family HTH domain
VLILKNNDTTAKAQGQRPEYKHILKERGLNPGTVTAAFVEAGKIGLDRNARFNKDRDERRQIIADRIKLVRQTHKLTQEQISEIIDWNTLTYRGYENCKSDVPMVILLRLADYYKVSMDYLTGRTVDTAIKSSGSTDLEERIAKLESLLEVRGRD